MVGEPMTPLRFERLLLTGAAGNLGRELRPRLRRRCKMLRVSDRAPLALPLPGEELCIVELADGPAVDALVAGVDAIVHFGALTSQAWAPILAANIVGVFNLYEAARRHGVTRVVFASSNHVTGFYRQDEVVTTRDPVRPDGIYGLSKAFGENVAQLYWNKHGIETVSLRIGSSFTEPKDRRMLATWLSFDDLERLVISSLTAPVVGHTIIYGTSDNPASWWDNRHARHLGYRAQDSSEPFRAMIEARQPTLDTNDAAVLYQGGLHVTEGPAGS